PSDGAGHQPADGIARGAWGKGRRCPGGVAERVARAPARTTWPHAPGTALLFYLRRRTTFRRQGDVGERRVGRGSMPMFLFRGNVHYVAGDDDLLLRFCGDDALAGGHEHHLITTVSVHFVTRPRAEVDDTQIEVVARLGREQRLPRHRTTGEQGSVHGLSWDLARFVYLHLSILLSGYRAFLVSRESIPASPSFSGAGEPAERA